MSNTQYIPRTVGNLDASGKEFKILASNVSFEVLAKYDNYIRGGGSSAYNSSTSLASSSGIGRNIANAFIICAPQTKATTVTYTYNNTYSWLEGLNGDGIYNKDTEYVVDGNTDGELSYTSVQSTEDYGKYDLVVTDGNGIPAVVTPPFNDIDQRYFSISVGADDGVNPSRKDYCKTTSLTLSYNIQSSVGNSDKFISYAPYSFTYITDEGMRLIQVKSTYGAGSRYYVCKEEDLRYDAATGQYAYTYLDGTGEKHIYASDSTISRADYSYVLNEMIKLREWKSKNFPEYTKTEDPYYNTYFDGWTLEKKMSYLLKYVSMTNNTYFVMRHDDSTPAYLWSGTKDKYNAAQASKDTTYIIQGD